MNIWFLVAALLSQSNGFCFLFRPRPPLSRCYSSTAPEEPLSSPVQGPKLTTFLEAERQAIKQIKQSDYVSAEATLLKSLDLPGSRPTILRKPMKSPVGGSSGGRTEDIVYQLSDAEKTAAYYNLAVCAANSKNDLEKTIQLLQKSFDAGFNEPKSILKDRSFPPSIRENKIFVRWVKKKLPPFPFSLFSK